MSIMERYSPLNLSYKVIVVTNASSPVGIVVCKTLLKANALVLGVDTQEKHDSLSASAYSHFQFCRCELTDDAAVDAVIADARDKFKTERVDALVNLAHDDDGSEMRAAHRKLADACVRVMEAADGGSIVNCTVEAAGTAKSDTMEDIGPQAKSDKVRCNTVANAPLEIEPCHEYVEAQSHFEFLFKPASHRPHKEASVETRAMHEFSNVVLFLASGLSEGLNGVILDRRGQLVQN